MRRFLSVTSLVLALGLAACNKGQNQAAQNQPANVTSGDPADGNLASAPESASPAPDYNGAPDYDQSYDQDASYQQPIEASEPPPPLPDYDQPPAPGDDYVWTPGYWSYADGGYYWVPGAWVLAPYVGALWTPPWWGFADGYYHWHPGYWAPHIGFYGGIDYGFGYAGRGYYGAYWNHGHLDYNRAVTNVDPAAVHNVYNYNAPRGRGDRVSYNGGNGGIEARPTAQELAVVHEPRTPPVPAQAQHAQQAAANRGQFVRPGGGAKPAALVASRPLPTTYRAPAPRPPAPPAARPNQVAERPAPRPAQQSRPVAPENREPIPGAVARRQVTPQQPEPRPLPQARPEARPVAPQRPEPRPEARPAAPPRPIPEARPETQPVAPRRQAPEARPEARPVAPPRPQARPAPPPRPAPQARPEARPAAPPRPAPKPENRKER